MMDCPVAVEPVKPSLFTSGCSASALPASPRPVTMLITPAGKPASTISSPSRTATSEASSEGFSTTVQPTASAGAILVMHTFNGAFQGVMAPTTPTGSLMV